MSQWRVKPEPSDEPPALETPGGSASAAPSASAASTPTLVSLPVPQPAQRSSSLSSASTASSGRSVTATNAYYSDDGELFYSTLLHLHERGRWVPITQLAIMDPGRKKKDAHMSVDASRAEGTVCTALATPAVGLTFLCLCH